MESASRALADEVDGAAPGPRTRWFGEGWTPGFRVGLVLALTVLYVVAFVPVYSVGGRLGALPLSGLIVIAAGGLLGLRAALIGAVAMLPLHTGLLNLAGESGWDVLLRLGAWVGSLTLFVTGAAVGFLRDLARRVEGQGREIEAQRLALADQVAARARMEEALRLSEARYRDLVENASDLIYTYDLEGSLTSVNAAVEGALGFAREELIGTDVQDLVVSEHRDRAREATRRMVGGAAASRYEVDALASDGEGVPLEVSARLVYGAGSPVGVEAIARDVSERRRTDAALRASEARFRAIFDSAGVGVAVTNLLGQVQECNDALEEMLGEPLHGPEGRLLVDLAVPEDASEVAGLVQAWRAVASDRQRVEARLLRADGGVVQTSIVATLVRDDRGAPWFGVVAVEDITERVRQRERREALLRAARRLALAASRADVLADLVGDAEALASADAAAVYRWDQDAKRLVGIHSSLVDSDAPFTVLSGQGAVGRAAELGEPVVIDDYQAYPTAVPRALEAGVRAVAAVPMVAEGHMIGVIWVGTRQVGRTFDGEDVEVLELLASAAAASIVGLDRARLAGVLLTARTAEHELNNRLAPTLGYAELLAADERLPEDLREIADRARRGAAEAAEIVERLQGITRLTETDWGPDVGPTIDVLRSTREPAD